MSSRSLLFSVVVVLLLSGLAAPVQAAYYVTDLGSLGGPSHAMAINISGEAVGYSYVTADTNGEYRAFLYSHGTITDLLGANSYSAAYGINDSGKIVGGASNGTRLFTYDQGSVIKGNFGGANCEAYGINNSGTIVGYTYFSGDTNCYGFVLIGDSASILFDSDPNLGLYTSANAVNDNGWVVGSYNETAGSAHRAFLFDGEYGYDLDTLGGSVADAYAINAGGVAVGSSTLAGDAATHAFLLNLNAETWSMTDLGALGGSTSEAWGINAAGQIVGYATTAAGAEHAFLYDGAMTDLNSQIAPTSGWTLSSANAINDSGWIVGDGTNASGDGHAFLLRPAMSGDADLNGTVNGADLNAVLSNYNQSGMDWLHGDFNGDGTVNGADLNAVLSNYNQTAASSSAAVPEPALLASLVAGAACLSALAWRRKSPPTRPGLIR